MLAAVTGTYKNGQISLDEELPVKNDNAKLKRIYLLRYF